MKFEKPKCQQKWKEKKKLCQNNTQRFGVLVVGFVVVLFVFFLILVYFFVCLLVYPGIHCFYYKPHVFPVTQGMSSGGSAHNKAATSCRASNYLVFWKWNFLPNCHLSSKKQYGSRRHLSFSVMSEQNVKLNKSLLIEWFILALLRLLL